MDDKTYQAYDGLVLFLMHDIAEKTAGEEMINLNNFVPEDKEHLVIFNAALYTASLQNRLVAVNLPLFQYIGFWFKYRGMRKLFRRVGKGKELDMGCEIDTIYKKLTKEDTAFLNGFGCIYDEYYDPKRKDKND